MEGRWSPGWVTPIVQVVLAEMRNGHTDDANDNAKCQKNKRGRKVRLHSQHGNSSAPQAPLPELAHWMKGMPPFLAETPKQECKSLEEVSSYLILQKKTFRVFL